MGSDVGGYRHAARAEEEPRRAQLVQAAVHLVRVTVTVRVRVRVRGRVVRGRGKGGG